MSVRRRHSVKIMGEPRACRFCGEGVKPGIRPKDDQHADPQECFTALKVAVRETQDCLRELVASIDAKQTRVIKASFAVERDGKYPRWTIIVTDPLGNDLRMAKLVAHTWAAVYESAVAARKVRVPASPESNEATP